MPCLQVSMTRPIFNTLASSFQEHPIKAISYSPTHRLIVAGSEKGTLQVFQEDLTYKTAFYLHHQGIQGISLAKDYLMTVSVDGQAILSLSLIHI